MIPLSSCRKGYIYRLDSRNLSYGVFDGEIGFIGIRSKFGDEFLFTEDHWDIGAPYGTAKPLEEVGPVPEGIDLFEVLSSYRNRD